MSGQKGRKSWNVRNAFIHSFDDLKDVKEGTSVIRWKDLKMHEFESNPYGYIQTLYKSREQKVPKPRIGEWHSQLLMGLHLKYLERRLVKDNFDLIPSLNSHDTTKVKNGQVVTFRCMLQDELGPEYSSAEYTKVDPITGETEKGSTLLKDHAFVADCLESFSNLSEKDVYVGVSPPAESFWVSQPQGVDEEDHELSAQKKKKLDKSSKDKNLIALPNYRDIIPSIFTELGETKPMACRLKIYKTSNENMSFKTNDVVQVIGLIQLPVPASNSARNDNDAEEENITSDLVKLPVLHVFSVFHLAGGNPNVLWLDVKAFPLLRVSNIDVEACATTLRELLSLGLGGDRTAASYAMLAMVAQVHYPDESLGIGTSPIGKYILNISGVPETSEVAEWFTNIVKALTPRALRFDFSVEKVNGANLIPTKNLDTNILESGLLQLPNGTQLLIDETKLNVGKFEDQGCRNMLTLRDLLTDQEVKYNYTYQHPAIRASFPTMILSTSASVLPYDVRVQVSYVPDAFNPTVNRRAKIDKILKEKGDMLRYYITFSQLIIKHARYGFDESDVQLQDDMTEYLVDRNNSDMYNNRMTPSEFAAFVTSCRLWCVLHGSSNQITRESYMAMRDLERIRDGRIAKIPK